MPPVEYDPCWKETFAALRSRIVRATGLDQQHIQHIGSTSVEGMRAKPIIDIQVGVANLEQFDLTLLSADGFEPVDHITDDDPFRDPGNEETRSDWTKKYARLTENGTRIAHLHIRQLGKANHRFALLFRDFLRSDPETCQLYSDLKIAAAKVGGQLSGPGGTGVYLDLKDPFVQLIACRAEDWAQRTGWCLSS